MKPLQRSKGADSFIKAMRRRGRGGKNLPGNQERMIDCREKAQAKSLGNSYASKRA